jgi:hypothetical protein
MVRALRGNLDAGEVALGFDTGSPPIRVVASHGRLLPTDPGLRGGRCSTGPVLKKPSSSLKSLLATSGGGLNGRDSLRGDHRPFINASI